MQSTIRFDKYSGCFNCGAPQEICNRWESNGRRGWVRRIGGECQFSGVMAGALYGIKHGYPEVWERWRQELEMMGVYINSEGDIVGYLGRRWKEDEFESNRLVWAFTWQMNRIESLIV